MTALPVRPAFGILPYMGGKHMRHLRWAALPAAAALLLSAAPLLAGDLYSDKEPARPAPLVLPKPAEIQSLSAHPRSVALKGADDAAQLVLTAALNGGRTQDLTADVKYEVAD